MNDLVSAAGAFAAVFANGFVVVRGAAAATRLSPVVVERSKTRLSNASIRAQQDRCVGDVERERTWCCFTVLHDCWKKWDKMYQICEQNTK